MDEKSGKRDRKDRDGWRSISRKFVRKSWPGEMESSVMCLFWLRSSPRQAFSLGAGRERCRGVNRQTRERLKMKTVTGESIKPGKAW